MALFKIENNDNLEQIKELPFKLEKEIQDLTEKNIKTIFGLEFVRSEFGLNNFRIDTLAFDKDSASFVIIEYKRDKNFSVIDQGYAYLSLMLNNKADFILEYNENNKDTLKRDDIDWSQSRVLFISPSFTTYQKEAINFKDLPIELWEIKRYNNKTVNYNQIQTSGAQESVGNRRLAQWRVTWLIEHSTSHQLLWCIDSFVLRNPPLRQAPKRYDSEPAEVLEEVCKHIKLEKQY
jgi:hypothetical protein